MRIGALARRTGVSERLLRHYEAQSLLRPTRNANDYREYTDQDVVTVAHIRYLLAAGLSTAVIAELLDCIHDVDDQPVPSGCPELMERLDEQRERLTVSIARLRDTERALESIVADLPR
jgi:DNA-binding transcriptional MerR regulator